MSDSSALRAQAQSLRGSVLLYTHVIGQLDVLEALDSPKNTISCNISRVVIGDCSKFDLILRLGLFGTVIDQTNWRF